MEVFKHAVASLHGQRREGFADQGGAAEDEAAVDLHELGTMLDLLRRMRTFDDATDADERDSGLQKRAEGLEH